MYCELRYQRQWYDAETGLYYNRHRYYDAESGQYLSPDPIGLLGGIRPQGYVHNPLELCDPFGLASCKLPNRQTVADFEKSLVKRPVNERVPVVKDMAESVANQNGWTRAKNIESKNKGRTIYQDGKHYSSVDAQHGCFEQISKKNGKHMAEIDMGENPISNSIDKSGEHDLVVK